jgi:hypothetical protein
MLDCKIIDSFSTPLSITLLDAICLTVYSFYDCIKTSNETLKQKYELACSITQFFKVLKDKRED